MNWFFFKSLTLFALKIFTISLFKALDRSLWHFKIHNEFRIKDFRAVKEQMSLIFCIQTFVIGIIIVIIILFVAFSKKINYHRSKDLYNLQAQLTSMSMFQRPPFQNLLFVQPIHTDWKFYSQMELKQETYCDLDPIGFQMIQT